MRTMIITAIIWNAILYLLGGWSLVAGMFILNVACMYGVRYLLKRAFYARHKIIEHKGA